MTPWLHYRNGCGTCWIHFHVIVSYMQVPWKKIIKPKKLVNLVFFFEVSGTAATIVSLTESLGTVCVFRVFAYVDVSVSARSVSDPRREAEGVCHSPVWNLRVVIERLGAKERKY